MYLKPVISCSALLHLLAQYPKTIIIFGLAATVSYTGYSPLGTGSYAGLPATLDRIEASAAPLTGVTADEVDRIAQKASFTKTDAKYVLDTCLCHDISPEELMDNRDLRNIAARIYIYDLLARYKDVETVKDLLKVE